VRDTLIISWQRKGDSENKADINTTAHGKVMEQTPMGGRYMQDVQ